MINKELCEKCWSEYCKRTQTGAWSEEVDNSNGNMLHCPVNSEIRVHTTIVPQKCFYVTEQLFFNEEHPSLPADIMFQLDRAIKCGDYYLEETITHTKTKLVTFISERKSLKLVIGKDLCDVYLPEDKREVIIEYLEHKEKERA